MAEDDIKKTLSGTRVEVAPETFTLVSLTGESWFKLLENPELSPRMTAPFMILKDRFEVTLLLDETDFRAMRPGLGEARVENGFRLLTFDVELDFSVVGFLAFVTAKLAEARIPVVALSAFSRDHLLIKQADLAGALRVLGEFVDELC
ncbi:MAG: ACT domain-containing protein [Acidobacteria bacterium]|nr:ACT domain-containing protein [Acidobacteriota bacterium]